LDWVAGIGKPCSVQTFICIDGYNYKYMYYVYKTQMSQIRW